MERRKIENEDNYWELKNPGFSFDEYELSGDSKLSAVFRKNDALNQLHLLRYDGYSEVAETSSNQEYSVSNVTVVNNEKHIKSSKRRKKLKGSEKSISHVKGDLPEKTVTKILLGMNCSLDIFKGRKDKLKLLKAAVETHDSNTILLVIFHLKSTFKKSVFQREIASYPDAVNVYISYMEEDHEMDELTNFLLFLNKAEDAAILKYEKAVAGENPEKKLKWIENCLSTCFQMDTIDPLLCRSVNEHKQILQDQICLNMQYEQLHQPNIKDMKTTIELTLEKLTGKSSIIDSSVLSTFIFCWLLFANVTQTILNPDNFSSKYKLSKKQFTWCVLKADSSTKRWEDIDKLFMSKSWLKSVKVRSCIAFSRLLEELYKSSAPIEVLSKYIIYIEDEEEKLNLAKKYQCHSVVLEIFNKNKDHAGYLKYMSSLTNN